ncbi:NAD-dependent protein deacetylase sirtuin-2 isoform X3 [Poecile atricapillus]|uniref:NAD-dependent protein deacetylase sirtuin-2 isoform X3 n=1 Tax=Poecile atricapillus TaxID=48891 RepID=UPI0027398421|nr:NAD-dependent protein deacetylase sirtuin-2 isoform X3 [Poecile atricapillus]
MAERGIPGPAPPGTRSPRPRFRVPQPISGLRVTAPAAPANRSRGGRAGHAGSRREGEAAPMEERGSTGGAGTGPGAGAASPPAPAGDPAGDPPAVPAAPGAREEEAEQDAESPVSEPEAGASADADMELLRTLLSRSLGLGGDKPEPVLDELSLQGVSRFLRSDRCKNIVCMVGAGISTSAGIPDFRSPGTGLYSNLQSYNLPYPEAIFEIGFFKKHPEPFFALARELYPGQFKPTVCHYFMRLLQDKGLLLRCYTQNIDTLERVAGLEPELLVEAHGTFFTSHCLRSSCRQRYDLAWMRERIFSSLVPKCEKCQGLVKPDIVFFGENLPSRFFTLLESDFEKVDLLLIMGTSLQVQPFASLISRVPTNTPRLLINKEKTGQSDPLMSLMGFGGMDFDSDKAYRDVAWLGDCDSGCLALAELLGWKEELQELVRREHAAIDARGGDPQKEDKDGGNPRKSLGDEAKAHRDPEESLGDKEKAQGDPKKSLGDKAKAQSDPKKPQGDKAKAQSDPKKPQGDKAKAQSDPKKSQGSSEDPPNSTGGTPQN